MLWMIHSAMIFLICVATYAAALERAGEPAVLPGALGRRAHRLGLLSSGRCANGRGRCCSSRRQVAHVWAGAVASTISVFIVEILLGMPVLSLTPLLAVIAGMTFVVKAGTLSGWFYLWAAAEFLSTIPIALWPDVGPLIFGGVTAISFFIPGLIYHRQRQRTLEARRTEAAREE